MPVRQHALSVCLLVIGMVCYAVSSNQLRAVQRTPLDETLKVVMPAYIQVVLAWGDRYLAANLGMLRAITLNAAIRDPASYAVQAKIQQQVSILNPYQEDNGYLAAAILPWEGQVDSAQWILERATQARYWDPEPPFYQGFNEYHFNKNNQRAGQLAIIASDRSTGKNKRFFRITASKWLAKTADKEMAVNLLKILKQTTGDEDIKRLLDARIRQIQGLQTLQKAMDLYKIVNGRPTWHLSELLSQGYLLVLPEDPFKYGYAVNEQGEVIINRPARAQQ